MLVIRTALYQPTGSRCGTGIRGTSRSRCHGGEDWRVILYRGRESEDGRHEEPPESRRATC